MFEGATLYNPIINAHSWNTNKVANMSNMFKGCEAFNRPIMSLDTSNVYDMSNMFNGAILFNQDISSWKLKPSVILTDMFTGATNMSNKYKSGGTSPRAGYDDTPTVDFLIIFLFQHQTLNLLRDLHIILTRPEQLVNHLVMNQY